MSRPADSRIPDNKTPRGRGTLASLRDLTQRTILPQQGPPMTILEEESLSPIPQYRQRSRPIDSASSFGRQRSGAISVGPPVLTSTPLPTSGRARGEPPLPLPRNRDMYGQPLKRERSGAISTQISQANLEQMERSASPQPMQRARSSAISSDVFSRRRSGVVSRAVPIGGHDEGTQLSSIQLGRQGTSGMPRQQPMVGPYFTQLSDDSMSIPGVQPHGQYIEYDRSRRQNEAVSAFEAYDPFSKPGTHRQFGEPGIEGREYPYPSTASLGQSQTGYTAQHPSEEHLPRTQDDSQRRAVYGTHEGLPIQGAANWQHYYQNWQDVGQQYQENINIGEALTPDEEQFALKYGFIFDNQLGRGSYGTVWLVKTTNLFTEPRAEGQQIKYIEKELACKVLSLKKFQTAGQTVEDSVKKLIHEADLHQKLNHRCIVKCEHVFYIHDQKTGFPFCRLLLFMELCDGDVKSMLEKHPNKKFDEKQAMDMLNGVTDALEYLHNQNICHFDIKIHNIMYVREGGHHICYKLADFGISKKYVSERVAKVYGAQGTRLYMAPELTRTPKGMSESKPADIYSLGCLLAEVLTGRAKFRQLFKDLKEKGLTAEVYGKWELSLFCAQLIAKMVDESPKNRPTVAQVRQDPWFTN